MTHMKIKALRDLTDGEHTISRLCREFPVRFKAAGNFIYIMLLRLELILY